MRNNIVKYIICATVFFLISTAIYSEEKILIVPKGGNLASVMREAGIPNKQTAAAINALSEYFNLKSIQPGQKITVSIVDNAAENEIVLKEMILQTDFDEEIRVYHNGWDYEAYVEKLELCLEAKKAEGIIDSSFYSDMATAGVPGSKIMELFRYYSFDVDFQRDIRKGDTFKVMYLDFVDADGNVTKHGPVIFSELNTAGNSLKLYGFVTDGHIYDFYNEQGKSMRKTLLKTPVANAIISSSYGKRVNPIYGYESFHKGLDFAAPKNTPIIASGSGIVESASWFDVYGNCVIIRHTNGYKTLYGHMNAFTKGITKGTRVAQGQIIGYVGTTGMSTGYHLHYEVIFNGVKINPASVKSPPERNLSEKELVRFGARKAEVDDMYNSLKKMD